MAESLLYDIRQEKSRGFWIRSFKFCLLLFVALVGAMIAMTLWNVENFENHLRFIGLLFFGIAATVIHFICNVIPLFAFFLFIYPSVQKIRRRTMLAIIQTALETETPIASMVRMYAFGCFSRFYAKKLNRFADLLEHGKTLPQALSIETGLVRYDAAGIIQLGGGEQETLRLLQKIGDGEKHSTFLYSLILVRFCYLLSLLTPFALIVMFILLWIVPQFQKIYEDFGLSLPLLTRYVFEIGDWIRDCFILLIPIAFAITLFLMVLLTLMTDMVTWRPFGFRRIFRRVDSGKLLRMFAVSVTKNISIPQTLYAYSRVTPSNYLISKAMKIKKRIENGLSWITVLRKEKYLTNNEAMLAESAERTGNLDTVILRIADNREFTQITKIDLYGKLLFSACLLIFGTAIGVFVIAMFVPLVKLINMMSG